MRYGKILMVVAVVAAGLLLGAGCGKGAAPADEQIARAEKLARAALFKDYCTSEKTEDVMQAFMKDGTPPATFDVFGVPVEKLAVSHETVKRNAETVVVFTFAFPADALGKGALAGEARTDVKVEIAVRKDGSIGLGSSY